jgi:hypothetical protein
MTNEEAARDLSMAKTIEERNSILVRHYSENIGNKVGDALLLHHLAQLETVTSHLDDISYGSLKVTTIKNVQFLPLIKISLEKIDEIMGQSEIPQYATIASIWPSIKRLFLLIFDYEGDPEPLYNMLRLAHRAAKISLEGWERSTESETVSRYSQK